MTSLWGPLGWMTLHSMASLYSETPSDSERKLMISWLDHFRDTITCPSCHDHFTTAVAGYRAKFPSMMNSRQTFLVATFRLHNSVNRRLNKPMYKTMSECFETLRAVVKTKTTREYRLAYYTHVRHHWKIYQDASGMSALRKIGDMMKIEAEYASPRTNNFENQLDDDVVVIGDVPPPVPGEIPDIRPQQSQAVGRRLRFAGGVMRFG
jgi:hypothetical protein